MNGPRLPTQGLNFQLAEGTKLKQDLIQRRLAYIGMKEIVGLPSDSPGAHLLRAFHTMFKKSGNISEGVLTDIIWGLRQSADFSDDMIGAALTQLRSEGFIHYSNPEREKLSEVELIESGKPIWVRYNKKFMDTYAAV